MHDMPCAETHSELWTRISYNQLLHLHLSGTRSLIQQSQKQHIYVYIYLCMLQLTWILAVILAKCIRCRFSAFKHAAACTDAGFSAHAQMLVSALMLMMRLSAQVVDFQWHPTDKFTMVSVSEHDAGGTLQLWRICDLITMTEEEAMRELEKHRCADNTRVHGYVTS